jgi:ATPase family associated with various cellular activities (AAA)
MEDCSFWHLFVPREINYFRLPVYDHFRSRPYHAQTVHQELDVKQMREDLAAELVRSDYVAPDHKTKKREWIRRLLFRLAEDLFCYVEDDDLTIFAPTRKEALEHAERLSAKYGKERPAEKPGFYLLKVGSGSIDAECIKITRSSAMSADDLALHYGPDVVKFEEKLTASLREHAGGASVFRGEPGTGKTSFIRHLIARLHSTHRFYYLPMNAESYLASPDLVEFWLHEGRSAPDLKKVVVLEDAEDLLTPRAADNRSKVSSLLNIADGLLGEFLQMHMICTINCDIDQLDPAIGRPGRLIACREFKRLDYDQAHRLR